MPDQFNNSLKTTLRPLELFRQRHHEIEKRRADLIARLMALKEPTRSHPGYRRALRLLNNTFSKASLRQRPAILKAAIWLINITEHQATTAAKASDDYPVEGTGSNQRLRCEDNFKRLVQKINPQGKAAE
jgi:hypothetical protein